MTTPMNTVSYSKLDLAITRQLLTLDYPDFFMLGESETGRLYINSNCYLALSDYLDCLSQYAFYNNDLDAFMDYFRFVKQWTTFSNTNSFYNAQVYTKFLSAITTNLWLTDDAFIALARHKFNTKILIHLVWLYEDQYSKNPDHIALRNFLIDGLVSLHTDVDDLITFTKKHYTVPMLKISSCTAADIENKNRIPDAVCTETEKKDEDPVLSSELDHEFKHKYSGKSGISFQHVISGALGNDNKLTPYHEKVDFYKRNGHPIKTVSYTTAEQLNAIQQDMNTNFPHFFDITATLCSSIALLMCAKNPRPLVFKPTLLIGAPGMGKTTYLKYFSGLLDLPYYRIDVGNMTNGFVLNGSDTTWSSGKPGRIAQHLITDYGVANPFFVLDEIDKAARDPRGNIEDSLLPLLEDSTAREFNDEFFNGLKLDVSNFSFFATANDESLISSVLLSRFNILYAREPLSSEMALLIQQIYTNILRENNITHLFCAVLEQPFIEHIIQRYGKSLRDITNGLRYSISHTATQYVNTRNTTASQDVCLNIANHIQNILIPVKKRPIGF